MKKPELLLPAGSLEVLKTAVRYGADAVYAGGEAFSLRAKARNFSMEDLAEGIAFAHEHGAKVYVTANILAHNDDLEKALKDGRAELFNLRFQMATSQLDNTARIKLVKKDIARVLTEIRARQIQAAAKTAARG